MKIEFVKISGSGNDFVLIDDRESRLADIDIKKLVRYLAKRRIGVGADGVIFLRESDSASIAMRYYNSDGSEAAICGNGLRCAAYFARMLGLPAEISIETGAGVVHANVDGNMVTVSMPDVKLVANNVEIIIDTLPLVFDLFDSGVPHAVTMVEDVETVPVSYWGRIVRWHKEFAPEGANVDFVEVVDDNTVKIRTYERGVEEETLSCGTGAVASAVAAARKGLVKPPVSVLVKLPDTLIVNFEPKLPDAVNVKLKGRVDFVFEGKITLNERNFR